MLQLPHKNDIAPTHRMSTAQPRHRGTHQPCQPPTLETLKGSPLKRVKNGTAFCIFPQCGRRAVTPNRDPCRNFSHPPPPPRVSLLVFPPPPALNTQYTHAHTQTINTSKLQKKHSTPQTTEWTYSFSKSPILHRRWCTRIYTAARQISYLLVYTPEFSVVHNGQGMWLLGSNFQIVEAPPIV